MNTLLLQQTGLTSRQIEKVYLDFFVMYAEHVAANTVEFQLMLTNKPLQQWFARQFKQGEQRYFAFMARTAKPVPQKRAMQLYLHFVTEFIDKYSKTIMYDIRKQTKSILAHHQRVGAKNERCQRHFN